MNSVIAVAKKVKARNDGCSPKEHVEANTLPIAPFLTPFTDLLLDTCRVTGAESF